MSIPYGQKSLTAGQPTIYNVSAYVGWVVIQNESPYELTVQIDGTGSGRSIPAQVMDKVTIPTQGFNGNIILTPKVILNNSSQAPSFAVVLDAYGPTEEPTGQYPVALSRSVQVGGEVTTVGGTATNLTNTSNPAGSVVANVRVPGDTADDFVLYNNGSIEQGAGRQTDFQIDYPSTLSFAPAPGTGAGQKAQFGLDVNNVLHLSTIPGGRILQIDGNTGNTQLDAGNGAIAFKGMTNFQVNGTTSGTMTVYQDFTGDVKRVLVYYNNFRNGTTVSPTVNLLAPFVNGAQFMGDDCANLQFLHSGTPQTLTIVTSANLSSASGTSVPRFSYGLVLGAFDSLNSAANNAAAHTGFVTITGI